jgi:hypothetical protein
MPSSHPTVQKHTHAHARTYMRIRLLSSKARLGTTNQLNREQPHASCYCHGCAPERICATHGGSQPCVHVPTLVHNIDTQKGPLPPIHRLHTPHANNPLSPARDSQCSSHGSARAVDRRRTSLWLQAHLSKRLAHAALAPFAVDGLTNFAVLTT